MSTPPAARCAWARCSPSCRATHCAAMRASCRHRAPSRRPCCAAGPGWRAQRRRWRPRRCSVCVHHRAWRLPCPWWRTGDRCGAGRRARAATMGRPPSPIRWCAGRRISLSRRRILSHSNLVITTCPPVRSGCTSGSIRRRCGTCEPRIRDRSERFNQGDILRCCHVRCCRPCCCDDRSRRRGIHDRSSWRDTLRHSRTFCRCSGRRAVPPGQIDNVHKPFDASSSRLGDGMHRCISMGPVRAVHFDMGLWRLRRVCRCKCALTESAPIRDITA